MNSIPYDVKKIFTPLIMMTACLTAGAETFINESFYYPLGNLCYNGGWVRYGARESNPVQVTDASLSFPGYADEAAGKSVFLANINGSASAQKFFRGADTDPFDGTVYYSALISVSSLPTGSRTGAFMALTGANVNDAAQFGDGVAGSEGGGVFIRPASDGKYQLGISRAVSINGAAQSDISWADAELPLDETVLVVVSYTQIDGEDNDTMRLWVNPAEDAAAFDAYVDETAEAAETLRDIRGIELAQRTGLTLKMPEITVDEVRVADSWESIFHPGGSEIPDMPEISLAEGGYDFGRVYAGIPYTHTFTVSGKNLTGDVVISTDAGELVALDRTTLPREEVMSENGAVVTVTLTPADSNFLSAALRITSEGVSPLTYSVRWSLVPAELGTTLGEYYDEETHDMQTIYVYRGEAVVTFVDTYYDPIYERVVNSIFVQDATGAVEIRSAGGCGYDEVDIEGIAEGDVITDMAGNLIFSDGGVVFVPRTAREFRIVDHGRHVEPLVMTLEQLFYAENREVANRLVKVNNIEFPDKYFLGGDFYGIFNSQKYEITDPTETAAWMWRFNGADYRNQPTDGYFDSVWNLTGILYETYPLTIGPRSFADFEFVKKRDINAVDEITTGGATVTGRYDLLGRPVADTYRGLVIETLSDGTTRKLRR